MERNFDVCVIGSGASGAIVANELASRGWDVAIVEQGDIISPGTELGPLIDTWEKAFARDEKGEWGLVGYPWTACAVGGGTVFYGGVSFRYREVDFDARHFVAKDALDPKWPIQYADLHSYYNEVETMLSVCADPSGDPLHPSGSGEVLSPHPISRRGEFIQKASLQLGLHPFRTPLAIKHNCERLTSCTSYSCPIDAKSDTYSRLIRPILSRDNVVLYKNTKAIRFVQNNPFEVSVLECIDLKTKKRFDLKARYFVLAANAIQSAALVLRSTNKWWPEGIGNEYNMVGAGLSFKNSEYISGWVQQHKSSLEHDTMEQSLRGLISTVSLMDYYIDSNCPSGLGGLIYESNPWTYYGQEGEGVFVQLESIIADQPMFNNRVKLSDKLDPMGFPYIVLDYQTHDLDLQRLNYMSKKSEYILEAMGARNIQRHPSNYYMGSAHLHGTCRAGFDPRNSVVDKDGRFHNLKNLYVADGSYMPFSGGVNPTLTIQANAMRIARNMPN